MPVAFSLTIKETQIETLKIQFMKNGILKIFALLILGTAVLEGCSVENHGRRGQRRNNHHRDHKDSRYNDRDHNYNR
jgi:hypothetical protein